MNSFVPTQYLCTYGNEAWKKIERDALELGVSVKQMRAGRGIQWYATVDDDMPPNYRYPHSPTLDRGCATSYSTGYSTLRREMNTGGELCSFRDAKKMKSESISR